MDDRLRETLLSLVPPVEDDKSSSWKSFRARIFSLACVRGALFDAENWRKKAPEKGTIKRKGRSLNPAAPLFFVRFRRRRRG